ncbi:MAG: gas vesicle protein GvpG [Candidatus Omnitrophica bacterium]|nr:gas vesicle protein GvpG [Candidatus Omnitrophota bacterium]
MFLLDDILLAPVKGVAWLAQQIQKETNHQLFDPAVIKARLAELQEQLDAGLISEAELRKAESALLERLQAVRQREQKSSP